jgi:hypothetical protein
MLGGTIARTQSTGWAVKSLGLLVFPGVIRGSIRGYELDCKSLSSLDTPHTSAVHTQEQWPDLSLEGVALFTVGAQSVGGLVGTPGQSNGAATVVTGLEDGSIGVRHTRHLRLGVRLE